MRSRSLCTAMMLSLGLGLAGCASGQDAMDSVQNAVHDFNPFGTGKTPLPGQRKALFPEGVPGVHQGVPPELMRGAPQEPEVVTATPEPPPAAKPARPRVRAAAAPPAQRETQPRRQPRRTASPPPAAGAPAADDVWPAPPQAAPRQQPAQTTQRAAPAPAPQRAAPPAAAGGWAAPTHEPVPTQWPDPPKVSQ